MNNNLDQLVSHVHKSNSRKMLPITLLGVGAIIPYIIFTFQGMRGPDGDFLWGAFLKIVLLTVILGGVNVILFEIWTRNRLNIAMRVVADDAGELPQDKATESLLALIKFPWRFSIHFLRRWLILLPLIVFSLRFFYGIPWLKLFNLAMGIIVIFCLMSMFHYFIIKRAYDSYLTIGLKNFPQFIHLKDFESHQVSYRKKVFVFLILLVACMVWISTRFNVTYQVRQAERMRGQFVTDMLTELGLEIEQSLSEGRIDLHLTDLLSHFRFCKSEKILLIDSSGQVLIGPTLSEDEQRIIKRIPRIGSHEKNRGSSLFFHPLLLRLDPNTISAMIGGESYLLTVHPLMEEETYLITLSLSEESIAFRFLEDLITFIMFGAAIILTLLFAYFMSGDLLLSLSPIIRSTGLVAEGDLRELDPISADDELGVLAIHHQRMVEGLRKAILQINEASQSIDRTASEIVERTEIVASGTEAQSASVQEVTASMAEMSQTIKSVAESVETVASSTETSSASVLELSATISEVAGNAGDLSQAVTDTTASIEEMSVSIKEVAEHVQSVSARAEQAARASAEMQEALRNVESLAGDSASLSEQVTRNAEEGVQAVSSTIRGIEKIQESSDEATRVIKGLSKRAGEIGNILNVIGDITEETNLLALNAAIIAAQAGEHGRAFAVVADEIGDLAERTQASTSVIEEQIQAVQEEAQNAAHAVEMGSRRIEEGVKLSERAGHALSQILESSQQTLAMARKISGFMAKQAHQSEELLKFIENVSTMIGQVVTGTGEQAKGSEMIARTAEQMREIALHVQRATREQSDGSQQINQAIEHISQIINFINISQAEQTKASDQVLIAMQRISETAGHNAEAVEKFSLAVNNLTFLAAELREMVKRFILADTSEDKPEAPKTQKDVILSSRPLSWDD